MFTVFGATGHTGSVVANRLLDEGEKVRVAVRDPGKVEALRARGAEVTKVDLLDAASVAAALSGAEGAYLLIPPDPSSTDLVGRGRRIVDTYVEALRKSPIAHAAVLSSVGAQQPSGTGPIVTAHYAEQRLREVPGTAFTFVRAAYFMENLEANAWPMKQDGVLPVFGGGENMPFQWVATRDIGEVAAAALRERPKATRVIELSGPQEYSFEDAAREASAILGRPVKVTVLPLEAMVPAMMQAGVSQNVAELYREMIVGFGQGLVRFEGTGQSVRGKVPIGEVLRRVLA